MVQKKQYVLVGTEAVLLYEESQREFGRDTKAEIADLIINNNADIFVFPEDRLDEDMAFQQFIEQINGWEQITCIDKEYRDELCELIEPKLDNPNPELMEMWIGDMSFINDDVAIVHNIKEIKMVTADYEEPEKDSYLIPAEYNGKILVDDKALIKDRIYRDDAIEKHGASFLKFSHLNDNLSIDFSFAGGVNCYLRTSGDFIGFPAHTNGWVYNHQDNIQ